MKQKKKLYTPWEARPSTDPGSSAWVVWGHDPENAVMVSSFETGDSIQMPPERPLFTVCQSDGVIPKIVAEHIVDVVNAYQERKHRS